MKDVIGQSAAKARLTAMADEGRLPHAIMLCGQQGVGKLALAIGLARRLLGKTGGQSMLDKLEHPDLHFTYPTIKLPSMSSDHKPTSDDFAQEWHELLVCSPYFTMSEWMHQMGGENQQAIITAGESDELTRKLMIKSSQGGWKVSIIWLPERMNLECANKLLKLLEEPPHQTLFIMACQEPERLLETIRSRVQRIDIPRIAEDDIRQALIDKRSVSEETARHIGRMANGSWLKALQLLSSDSEHEHFLELYQLLMRLAYQRKIKELKGWTEQMAAMGREKQRRWLESFLQLTRENFMYNFHMPELCYMSQKEEQFAQNFARFINENNIITISEMAERAMRDIGQNANARIVFFDFALRTIVELRKS